MHGGEAKGFEVQGEKVQRGEVQRMEVQREELQGGEIQGLEVKAELVQGGTAGRIWVGISSAGWKRPGRGCEWRGSTGIRSAEKDSALSGFA